MGFCRNCTSSNLRDLGFIGQLAPFFLKRVYNLQLRERVSASPLKEFLRGLGSSFSPIADKIYGQSAFVEMQICRDCSFVQAKHGFAEGAIARLYEDYRSESYNAERIKYEPTYKAIASRVGSDVVEVAARVGVATEWLSDKVQVTDQFTMLDYGGADGRFLPRLPAKKFVFEISNIPPVDGVVRVAEESDLKTYSYIQLAHILEHVVEPIKLVNHVAQKLEDSGYIYIEVPQEMADVELESLKQGTYKLNIPIHEHINKYSISAVTKLIETSGLELVAIRADSVDLGWVKGVHLRALARKI